MNQEKNINPKQTQSKKPMPIFGKAILIYIGSVVLGLIISTPFGKLYRLLVGPYQGTSIGVIFHEGLDNFIGGFVFSYLFFLGLLVALFVKRKLWLVWLIGFVIIGWTATFSWKIFSLSLAFSILGFLLGKLILEIYKKAKKK